MSGQQPIGNANQAVAVDDFEAFRDLANQDDLRGRGVELPKKESAEPKAEKEPAEAKQAEEQAPPAPQERKKKHQSYGELRKEVERLTAENQRLQSNPRETVTEEAEPEPEPEAKAPEKLRARPKADDKAEDGKSDKYKTWQEYEDDLLAWNEEKILRTIDERNAKKTEEARVQAVNRTIEQSWNERVAKAREAHADYDEIALNEETGPGKLIAPGSIVDEWLMQSEHGAELLYYFGQHPEELRKFGQYPGSPAAVRRELVRLEDKISAPKQESKPAPKEEKPEVRTTKAPKPSSEVGGRGMSLPDPIAASIAGGTDADTGRYIEEMNRREVRRINGDRGSR